MNSEKMEILKRLTFKVLQEVCFLFQSDSLSKEDPEKPPILVQVDCGDTYTLFLQFDPVLAESITTNFLGTTREEIDDNLINSTVTEITNMVGGNFINQLNLDTSAKLSIPQILDESWSEQDFTDLSHIEAETLQIDKRLLQVAIVEHEK